MIKLRLREVEIAYDLRITLVLLSDGRLMLSPAYGFTLLYDHKPEGVSGVFDTEGFSLKGSTEKEYQEYEWETPYPYKQMPVLKQWLLQQDMDELDKPVEENQDSKGTTDETQD